MSKKNEKKHVLSFWFSFFIYVPDLFQRKDNSIIATQVILKHLEKQFDCPFHCQPKTDALWSKYETYHNTKNT